MGLATIDPHSQKGHTEIHMIPKFGISLSAYNFRLNNFDLSKETQKECIYRLDWLLLEGAYIRNNILVSKYKGYNRGGGGVSYNGDCVGFNV